VSEEPSPAARVSLRPAAGGVLVKVAARPGSGRDRVLGVQGDALRLGVAAPPDKGKANKALALLLAATLGVRRSAVSLESGETSREKVFLVEGVSVAEARAALERELASD
jgi:uncharacterized protein (TIGR00251 family)